jgi:L-cysteine desulfidase
LQQEQIIALLKAEVLPTTGCTEPGAVALAAAYASDVLEGKIRNITVIVNSNIYKNGVAVGIPGTGETGLVIAAALGSIKKHPEKQLSVLDDVTTTELQAAKQMMADQRIQVAVDETKNSLWVQVRMESEIGWSEAIIADKHTNLIALKKNGSTLFEMTPMQQETKTDQRCVLRGDDIRVSDLVKCVEALPFTEITFLLDGVTMNLAAAEIGIAKRLGMGIGAVFQEAVDNGLLSNDIINSAKILTAAASDARMSGENVKVMSSAGSGNHGITATLPVYAVAQKIGASQERLVRAIALSHVLTVYIKIYTGNLSALCGCAVAAATGASAAVTWLMGGKVSMIEAAMKNVIANLTGMICDGGKVGCALKLSTAAAVAVESSLLAQQHIVVPDSNGIIADTIERTIRNLGRVSNPGMIETDRVIMNVMLEKIAK